MLSGSLSPILYSHGLSEVSITMIVINILNSMYVAVTLNITFTNCIHNYLWNTIHDKNIVITVKVCFDIPVVWICVDCVSYIFSEMDLLN